MDHALDCAKGHGSCHRQMWLNHGEKSDFGELPDRGRVTVGGREMLRKSDLEALSGEGTAKAASPPTGGCEGGFGP